MKLIKQGTWITNNKCVYIVDDIEDRYAVIRKIIRDKNGVIFYGKKTYIGLKELDKFKVM